MAEKLQAMGYAPVTITQAMAGLDLQRLGAGFKRISTEDIVMFNIQLANMINSGLSIMSSLDVLQKQIENKRLKEIIGGISRSVESGESFSQALGRYPQAFSRLFVSMVKAGEASGNLDKVLTRYAEFAEGQSDLRQKIKGALFYPAVLIVAACFVIVFIVTSIVPKFVAIFNRVGIDLPGPTKILYGAGMAIGHFWYLIILAAILIFAAVKGYIRTESGKLKFDRFCLRLPIAGSLWRKSCISRFARTLSTLIASGVPILQSLDIVREVINNEILGGVVEQVHRAAEKGEGLSQTLRMSGEFPADAVQMISVGEESGNLEEMLNKIGDFYDRAIGYSIKKLTTILEPAFLVIMGAVVAFIMASMLLPMFDMIKLLRR